MIDFQLYFIWMSKNNHKYRMFAVFTYLNYHSSQTKKQSKTKQNMVMKTYEELLGTCAKSEKQHI